MNILLEDSSVLLLENNEYLLLEEIVLLYSYLSLPFIDNDEELYPPNVAQLLGLPFKNDADTLYTPTVYKAFKTLVLPRIERTDTTFPLSLNTQVSISLPTISESTIFVPTVKDIYPVNLPYIDASVVFEPILEAQAPTLELPYIEQGIVYQLHSIQKERKIFTGVSYK